MLQFLKVIAKSFFLFNKMQAELKLNLVVNLFCVSLTHLLLRQIFFFPEFSLAMVERDAT